MAIERTAISQARLSGPHWIDPNRGPTILSPELMYTMTLEKDIEHARSKVVVGAVFQDNVYVRAFSSTKEYMFRHISPSLKQNSPYFLISFLPGLSTSK
jgi:hypothetical protein